jgi:hypothetical protein
MTACGGGGGGSNGGGNSMTPNNGSANDTSHGTAACASGNAVFSVSPLALSSVIGWVPLGAMEPPGHTFPTDHQYLYFANPSSNVPQTVQVVAPSNLTIWMIYQDTGSNNDFSIWIQPCAQIIGRLGSISTLSSDLAAAAGPINQNCQTFGSSTQCQKALQYNVSAGQVIGTISSPAEFALDWWLWDSRVAANQFVDPAEFMGGPDIGFTEANIVPASAYYTASVSAQVAALLGSFDGTVPRTALPVGGTISVDVVGTARGYWFTPGQPYPPETYEAALAPDNITPATTEVISLGVSQTNVSNGALGTRASFSPVGSGLVNRAFESVTADGNLYCYQGVVENTAGQTGVFLLQMPDAGTLKIERLASALTSCSAAQPWTFSTNAVTYKR